MNAPHLCKLSVLPAFAMAQWLLTKRLHFLIFQLPKAEQRPLRASELVA
jgi:hypothetical protein